MLPRRRHIPIYIHLATGVHEGEVYLLYASSPLPKALSEKTPYMMCMGSAPDKAGILHVRKYPFPKGRTIPIYIYIFEK